MSAVSAPVASVPTAPVAMMPVQHELGCPNDPDGLNRLLDALPPPALLERQVAVFFEPEPLPEPSVCPACHALNNPLS